MKKTRKTIVLLFASLLILTTVIAQSEGIDQKVIKPEDRADKRIERMAKQLDLTEIQKAEMVEVQKSHEGELAALQAQLDALKSERKEIWTKMRSQMEDVLEPEQVAKMEALKAERKERFKEAKGHLRGRAKHKCAGHKRHGQHKGQIKPDAPEE